MRTMSKNRLVWLAAYTLPKAEKKANEKLQLMGINTLLPLYERIQIWSDRKKKIFKPLFPSYVFVKISSSNDFHKSLSIKGACKYIRFGDEYANISEEEIKRIKLFLGLDDITDIEIKYQIPSVGEFRTIKQGPLAGMEVEIVNVKNKNKLIVRVDSLKQNIIATIPLYFFQ